MAQKDFFNTVPRKSVPQRADRYAMDTLGLGQQLHGNIYVGNKGTGTVLIDGQNGRILITDGVTNRILIGDVEQ